MRQLMTGNEAVARGAWEAGVHFAAAYPGTPSTEIMENISTYDEITCEWSPNEKVAYEAAYGASLAGGRAMASMKHVGINVAADPLFASAYMGVNGGFVVISADEPGQHSSQSEQDNRNYAKAARLPMLEPSDSQECLDMVKTAFELSEALDLPVLIRLTTRICHSKSIVSLNQREEVDIRSYKKDITKTITVPAIARGLRLTLEKRVAKALEISEHSALNRIEKGNGKIGVISSGVCYYYAKEVFGETASYLKLGMSWPLPSGLMADFCRSVETIYIIEENDPYIEDEVRRLGFLPHGRDIFPFCGELMPDVLRRSLHGRTQPTLDYDRSMVLPRPPMLCAGCPHRGLFYELGKKKDVLVSGDIGCYTLAFSKPYDAMDWDICMGAAFSSGHGAQKMFDKKGVSTRVVSVMGDSTFFHTGINSLIDVAYNGSNTVNIILDNRITGMTGHQENPGSGLTIKGEPSDAISIEQLVCTIGIKHVRVINPNILKEVREALEWGLSLDAPSVIITRWPCVLKRFSAEDKREFSDAFKEKMVVTEKCIGCKACLKCGCPALSFRSHEKKAIIDRDMCVGCTVCAQVCPMNAIVKEGE
ncbi:indolepyruvate ferredoxin oxidoreductase subunit alpha [Oscillospiraceae bacterium LTW-04]|nr:indolepyruvate ferredoxin oxidoreductase subunit alpha [Oscillospiraceae bacterium MB24-C1]